jgi:putative Ca2+/H+ antiporter (TMEM165/GDT1 family)
MVAADAIAVVVGAVLGTRLPDRAIKVFAAGAFVLFGALLVVTGLGLL